MLHFQNSTGVYRTAHNKHKHKADLMEPGQMTSTSTSYI